MASSVQKDLIKSLSGKDSEPKIPEAIDKTTLIKLLSWYSTNSNPDSLKAYVIQYAKSKGMSQKRIDELSRLKPFDYQTFGALARISLKGGILDYNCQRKLDDYINTKQLAVEPESKTVIKVKKESTVVEVVSLPHLDIIDDCIDCIVEDRVYQYKPEPTKFKEISEYVKRHQSQLDADMKDGGITKSRYNQLSKFYTHVVDNNRAIYNSMKTTSTKKVSKGTMVKNVNYSLEKIYNFKQLSPLDVIGKKKMYTYDTKTRRLTCYVAVLDGFRFAGTSLKNYDVDKATHKIIRLDMLKDINGIAELNAFYTNLKTVAGKPSGRFNENTVLLVAS